MIHPSVKYGGGTCYSCMDFFMFSDLLFSTVVAKSALLIYNPSRDLQKMPEKRLLQSLRDLRADCLLLCQWFTTKFQAIPLSVLWEADAVLFGFVHQTKSLCETLQWLPIRLEGPCKAEPSAILKSGSGFSPRILFTPQEFNLILCLGCWDSNAVMLHWNLAWFKKKKKPYQCVEV